MTSSNTSGVPTNPPPSPIPMKKKSKRKGVSWYKRKLDKVFSLWVRRRERACVTCGARGNLQAGHFVSRSCNQLRFDERNVHTQCLRCNVFLRGNMVVYADFMERTYGSGILKEMMREKVKMKQWKVSELEELIKKYQ